MSRRAPEGRRWPSRLSLVLLAACSDVTGPPAPRVSPTLPPVLVLAAPTVRMIAAGDIASCAVRKDSVTADLVAGYLAQHPGATVAALGDNVYEEGTASDYANCYEPTWGRFKSSTRPALGNHEYQLGNATPSFDYFGALVGPRGLGYYSYDVGAWHVVVLNSNTGIVPMTLGSPQQVWLRNDLAANTKRCIIAYWHHPRFYSATYALPLPGSSTRQVWRDLQDAGATLVLSGHHHRYERFGPQDSEGNPTPRGIRQFVVGTGGRSSDAQPTNIAPNSEVVRGVTYGVLELQLGDGWYSWKYRGIPGETFTDEGTGTCVDRSGNTAPVASAGGPYAGFTGAAVTFDGSGSTDPSGDLPLTYEWDFGDGTTGSGVAPAHAYASAGTFTVTLAVTDARGLSGVPVTTTATVSPNPNQAPTARAGGPYAGVARSAVAFDGAGSADGDGDVPLTYAWDFGDGGTATGAGPTHVYEASGTYTVTLTVTDARGLASEPATTTATIAPGPNEAPVAAPGGPYAGKEGEDIAFDGTGSVDPDGNAPLAYAWDFGDGSTGSGDRPSHAYAAAGTYAVTLVVTDAAGLSGVPATTTVTVAPPGNQSPVAAHGGPYAGVEGTVVTFDGGGSADPDGNAPLTYEWTFGDGTTGSGVAPTHAYADDGTYTVTLTVTDALGARSAEVTTTVVVANAAPVVNAGADARAYPNLNYWFKWGFTDAGTGDGPWAYTIDWGDGTQSTGTVPAPKSTFGLWHLFPGVGTYTVTVTVRDKDGGTGSDVRVMTVR